MRRRVRWIVPGTLVILAVAVAFWPRHDQFDFLRQMGGVEGSYTPPSSVVGISKEPVRTRQFAFLPSRDEEVRAALDRHWQALEPGFWKTPNGGRAFLGVVPADPPDPERLLVAVLDQ